VGLQHNVTDADIDKVLSILAEVFFRLGRYEDCITTCQNFSTNAIEPGVKGTLAFALEQYSVSNFEKGNAVAGIEYLRQAFLINQELVEQFPEEAAHNARLASNLHNLGTSLQRQGKLSESLAMYQHSLYYSDIACSLAPHSTQWERWRVATHLDIGTLQRALGNPEEALKAHQLQVAAARRVMYQNPALSHLRGEYYKSLLILAEYQQQLGLNTEASRTRRDALDLVSQATGGTPEAYYEVATIHAWLAVHGTASSPETEEADNKDERQRHADLAVQTLRQAIKLGWSDAVALRNDKLWDPFRERDELVPNSCTTS